MYPTIRRILLLATFLSVIPMLSLHAQNRNEWSAFSALNAAQSVSFDRDGVLWVATTGGVVGYDPGSDSTQVLRTTEGLLSLNCSAVAIDTTTGDMYVGGADGSISIRKHSGEWAYSNVMASATQFQDRRINGFGFRDGRVFVLTRFGGGLYNPIDSTLLDNFSNLRVSVNGITFWHDSIWLATDEGLRSTPLSNGNLADPASWDIAVPELKILSLAVVGDSLLLGTDRGAYMWDNLKGVQRSDLPGGAILLSQSASGVVAASINQVFRENGGSFVAVATSPKILQAVALSNAGRIGVGFLDSGFGYVEGDSIVIRLPNAPLSNEFIDLALSADGSIWTANGIGVSRMKDGSWSGFTKTRSQGLGGIWNISAGAGGTIWAGSYGGGGVRFRTVDTGLEIINYTPQNSPVGPTFPRSQDSLFSVVGAAMADLNGRTWITNWGVDAAGPVLLVQLRPDEGEGDGQGFLSFFSPLSVGRQFHWLAIDDNGTKWLGSQKDGTRNGLFYYNDKGTPADRTDDDSGNITTNDGLPSNNVSAALKVDADGLLWIGTTVGLTVLVNPVSVVNNDQHPDFRPVRALKDITITAIAVDALNRKWIGTADQGVYLLSIDGSEVLAHYTTDNSPLVNNQVLSILAVNAAGDIYIGTANGLSKISTVAMEPPAELGTITVSPQPFLLPPAQPLRIAGLPGNATVKILSLNGSLIRNVPSPGGGVAFWDGADEAGAFVPSGVYLIAAESDVGDATVVGKVAVIKR
jgi:ligand-binding sensor domain-containing protein